MQGVRNILLIIAVVVSVLSIGLMSYSIAGFSLNKDIVLNTYWAKSVLGKYQITDDGAISILGKELDGLDLTFFWGLRVTVNDCSGKLCDGKGDDFVEPLTSDRINACYSKDSKQEDGCFACKDAGLAAGSLVIIGLFLNLIGLCFLCAGLLPSFDTITFKLAGIGMHVLVLICASIAMVVYAVQCYQFQVDNLYDGDTDDAESFDHDDIKFTLGPGFLVLFGAVALQFIVICVLLYFIATGAASKVGAVTTQVEVSQKKSSDALGSDPAPEAQLSSPVDIEGDPAAAKQAAATASDEAESRGDQLG